MDRRRYRKVVKPRADQEIYDNVFRVASRGRIDTYVFRALFLFMNKGAAEVVYKAMGRAINKALTIAELVKKDMGDLDQITSMGSTEITDTWEPLEIGLLPIETTRRVSVITITLFLKRDPTLSIAYRTPLPAFQEEESP